MKEKVTLTTGEIGEIEWEILEKDYEYYRALKGELNGIKMVTPLPIVWPSDSYKDLEEAKLRITEYFKEKGLLE